MNEMIEKIITRHAIRRFADRQLDEETLREILTAGLYAPSAGNNQYSRIVVCQDKAVNLKLGQLSRYMQFKGRDPGTVAHSISSDQPSIQDDFTIMDGFYGAPTVLTIFTRPGQYAHDDAAMIAENIMLAALEEGLGTCAIKSYTDAAVRKLLCLPDTYRIEMLMSIGYPEGDPRDPRRKPLEEILYFNQWEENK